MSIAFHFVDVFADEPLTGNPLALVDDADGLELETMRAIAREFNQSETTFILAPTAPGATVRLRSFTPNGSEVFGAGHNALGAWLWLVPARLSKVAPETAFAQQIGDEVLPVDIGRTAEGRTLISMAQSAPVFGRIAADRKRLAKALRLDVGNLAEEHAQVVSTGAGHLLVSVTDRSVVDSTRPDANLLAQVLADVGGEGCYVYSRDAVDPGSLAYTRFFNPVMGISEDPATGTAAGPLVALLVARGQHVSGDQAIVEQGFALGRPSRIRVLVDGDSVTVSGTGLVVADGQLSI